MKQFFTGLVIFAIVLVFYVSDGFKEMKLSEWQQHFSEATDDEQDDDDDEVDAKQQLVDGSLVVRISTDTQKLAGIKTILSENISVQSEDRAFATVIDIQDLLVMRSHYREAIAERQVANTILRNSAKLLEQLQVLHREASNISKRELQQASATWEEQRARIQAINIRLQNIRENMIHKWNTEITELALKDNSKLFDRLLNQKDYLVLMTLKPNQQLTTDTAFVFVNKMDERASARKAYFISAASFSDNTLQGETYFLRTNAEKIRVGMRLYVWLPDTGFSGEGVNIPEQAVVWYAGTPWAYVQVDDELFSRRSLLNPIETDNGWLVKDNFEIGERIVVSGAQTLLSEEFKWAIPDEDDD